MGFLFNKSNSIISDIFKLAESRGSMQSNWMYEISLYDKYLEIEQKIGGKFIATLKYGQIIDVQYLCENHTFNTNQSMLGRGIIGGLLAGPIGACIGAFTAGKKTKKKSCFYLTIDYISSSGEKEQIKFEDTRMYKGKRLAAKLKKLCGIRQSVEL